MKMPNQINASMLAPCGMNCMVCYRHCFHKKPCAGCLETSQGKPAHCRSCKLKDCAAARGLTCCWDCGAYPCKEVKRLDKSYRTRYGASLIENGLFVKEHGVSEFMRRQKAAFTCPACGGVVSLHDGVCSQCRGKVPKS